MTKQHTNSIDSADRPALQIEITPAMIEAGVEALGQLARHDLEANPYSLELLVREVLGSSLLFGAATATRANFLALQAPQISRAAELGLPPIGHPDVAAARAS